MEESAALMETGGVAGPGRLGKEGAASPPRLMPPVPPAWVGEEGACSREAGAEVEGACGLKRSLCSSAHGRDFRCTSGANYVSLAITAVQACVCVHCTHRCVPVDVCRWACRLVKMSACV